MPKYLYEVSLKHGRDNPKYSVFLENVTALNAKGPDFGGIHNVCVISHHMDKDTVRILCEDGLGKSRTDLTVTEITKESLASKNSHHRVYTDLVENYFLPYDDYPNIE